MQQQRLRVTKLAGDLGGTVDLPTTLTALHKTGNETKTGQLKLQGNQGDTFNLLQICLAQLAGLHQYNYSI
jgi:hypothetical protein